MFSRKLSYRKKVLSKLCYAETYLYKLSYTEGFFSENCLIQKICCKKFVQYRNIFIKNCRI